jgi:hypothetical protein
MGTLPPNGGRRFRRADLTDRVRDHYGLRQWNLGLSQFRGDRLGHETPSDWACPRTANPQS